MTTPAEFLRAATSVGIASHVDPDGDSLGSALGLAWILDAAGKRARVHLAAPIPRLYSFLPGERFIHVGEELAPDVDRLAVLDCTSPSRLGALERIVRSGAPLLNIDHHADNTGFGDAVRVDPSAAATAILIWEMAREA